MLPSCNKHYKQVAVYWLRINTVKGQKMLATLPRSEDLNSFAVLWQNDTYWGKTFVHPQYLNAKPSVQRSCAAGLSPAVLRKSGAETPSDLAVCNLQT